LSPRVRKPSIRSRTQLGWFKGRSMGANRPPLRGVACRLGSSIIKAASSKKSRGDLGVLRASLRGTLHQKKTLAVPSRQGEWRARALASDRGRGGHGVTRAGPSEGPLAACGPLAPAGGARQQARGAIVPALLATGPAQPRGPHGPRRANPPPPARARPPGCPGCHCGAVGTLGHWHSAGTVTSQCRWRRPAPRQVTCPPARAGSRLALWRLLKRHSRSSS
jgi:hypothetical protein